MAVVTEATPNPNAMKFISDQQIFQGDDSISIMPGQISDYPVLNELMMLEAVNNVFGYQYFITINKQTNIEWDIIIDNVIYIMESYGY